MDLISLHRSHRLDLGSSPGLDLGFIGFALENFCFPCCEPYSGIRAVSMRRSIARVERNGFVGVDAFCYLLTLVYSASYGMVG